MASDDVEFRRSENRAKINRAANCFPPLSPEDCKKLGIKVNVNWGELMILLAHARRQYMNAFWGQGHFFKVKLPNAPVDHQSEWEGFITELINRMMRKSNKYFELHRSRWAAVACHGMGPQIWNHSDPWIADFVALSDIRIPTDTTLDFENMDWFNMRRTYTPFELIDEVFPDPPRANNRWDKKAVAQILLNYKQINITYPAEKYDWMNNSEKLVELVRQDGGYWSSSAVPGIVLNHFYFKDFTDKNNKGWYMRVVPETGQIRGGGETSEPEAFLWTWNKPIAKKLDRFFHAQFGDLNNDAPFKVNSVRSLGFALMEPTFYTNLTRNRLLQHVHDNFNIWLQVSDPANKARAQLQEFGNLAVLNTGVNVVPQAQRHQIEGDLVEMTMAQLKQLQQEASASYTQNIDTGTQREQTAFETSVKMQQVNALTAGLLMTAFQYATGEYQEICRRFCIRGSTDEDVKKFRDQCKRFGIPSQWLDVDLWDVEPVTPLGWGNPAMAMTEAQQLVAISPRLDATAQNEINHEYVLTVTGDPRKAARWAPIGKDKGVSTGAAKSHDAFGSLMQGVPFMPEEGFPVIDQIEGMLPLLAGRIVICEQRDNMATYEEAKGFEAVVGYISLLLQKLAQDQAQKQRVKVYKDTLGRLANQIKGLSQRGAQHQQKQAMQNGQNGEVQAKVQAIQMQTAAKIQSKQATDQQKLMQKNQGFIQEQRRKDANTFADIQRTNLKAKVDAHNRIKSIPNES